MVQAAWEEISSITYDATKRSIDELYDAVKCGDAVGVDIACEKVDYYYKNAYVRLGEVIACKVGEEDGFYLDRDDRICADFDSEWYYDAVDAFTKHWRDVAKKMEKKAA